METKGRNAEGGVGIDMGSTTSYSLISLNVRIRMAQVLGHASQAGGECVGWSVEQVDHGELGSMHGMRGTLDAGLEVQRTIKEVRVAGLSCAFYEDAANHSPCGK